MADDSDFLKYKILDGIIEVMGSFFPKHIASNIIENVNAQVKIMEFIDKKNSINTK